MTDWKNRIVGNGVAVPEDLLAHPRNWRIHPKYQQAALGAVLDNVGWVQQVIVNQTTGHLIDGHLRVSLAMRNGETEIPVVYVELSEEEENTVLATFDPIAAMAETDTDKLRDLIEGLEVDSEALSQALDEISSINRILEDDPYTIKVDAPIYKPKSGAPPPVSDLYDDSKTQNLIAQIQKADLPDDISAFLIAAAHRHTVISYENVAEFYSHAEPAIQRLIEDSALIIIDFGAAIEKGYVKVTQTFQDRYYEEFPDE